MRRSNGGTGFALALLAGLLAALPAATWAGNWPGWRGSTGCGYSDEKNLPLKWDGKTGQGVLWKVPLKDTTGHSSPIVWEDRVFLTTAVKQTQEQEARKEIPDHDIACFQASDGKLLWKTHVAHGPHQEGYSIYAVPTPIIDGKAVYAWFGSGVVAAVDLDGKLLWRHERSGPFNLLWRLRAEVCPSSAGKQPRNASDCRNQRRGAKMPHAPHLRFGSSGPLHEGFGTSCGGRFTFPHGQGRIAAVPFDLSPRRAPGVERLRAAGVAVPQRRDRQLLHARPVSWKETS
jgi:hypothetical protein